jgi:hypothetical protein
MDDQEQETQITPPKPSWLNHKFFGYGFLVLVFVIVIFGIYQWQYGGQDRYIDSFDDCIDEVYGSQAGNLKNELDFCKTEDGRTFSNLRFETQYDNEANPTASWQTYTNEEFKFEFRYPNNLGVSDEREVEELDYFTLLLSDQNDRQRFNISIAVNEPGRGFDNTKLVSRTEVAVDSALATKTVLETLDGHEQGDLSIIYQFDGSGNEYLTYSTGGVDLEKTTDQILSTFKFIDSTSADTPGLQVEIINVGASETFPLRDLVLTSLADEPVLVEQVVDFGGGGWQGSISVIKRGEFTGESFFCFAGSNLAHCEYTDGYLILPDTSITLRASKEYGFTISDRLPEVDARGQNSGLKVKVIYK